MQENKEIQALLSLIDDPDEFVYESVSNRIISLGKDIIPNLEHFGETNVNNVLHEKIESLIHRLHFEDVKEDFTKWSKGTSELLGGALLIAKYAHPSMDTTVIFKEIEKLRRNIWLEMNSYLTPMEQINVIGSIVYNYYKQTQGWEKDKVDFNVFNVSDKFYTNGTTYDPKSIMHYTIEPWQTTNGYSLKSGDAMSDGDKLLIAALYPKGKTISDLEVPRINVSNFSNLDYQFKIGYCLLYSINV